MTLLHRLRTNKLKNQRFKVGEIERLKWDSEFFDKKIGSCEILDANEFVFDEYLKLKDTMKYDLIYLIQEVKKIDEIESQSKYLVDTKVVFTKNAVQTDHENLFEIVEFRELNNPSINIIYDLAIVSGVYSRFNLDFRFSRNDFLNLYKKWVDNSLDYTIADDVFLFLVQGQIVGFTTVSYKEHVAVIGLIAVDDKFRGKAIGTRLLAEVEQSAIRHNCTTISVATQHNNQLACKFYLKNKFEITELKNIYHI